MDLQKAEKKINKSRKFFIKEIGKLRGSRANPNLIEDIKVKVYGSVMPIKQLGSVNVVDPTLITVQCWDKNNAEDIKIAIQESDLNVVPSVDGGLVRVPLPPITEERRKELVKIVKKLAEEAKVSVRMIRRDFIDQLEEEEKSEDDIERGKKDIQKLVDKFNDNIEKEIEKKEKELMSI